MDLSCTFVEIIYNISILTKNKEGLTNLNITPCDEAVLINEPSRKYVLYNVKPAFEKRQSVYEEEMQG